jgi:hypothetical protein
MGLFSRDPDDDDADDAGSPFEGRGFILSAIVVGAVVVCGVAVLLAGRGSGDPSAGQSPQPTETVTTGPTTAPATEGPATPDPSQPTQRTSPTPKQNGPLPCKLPASEEGMDEAPAAVSWDFQNGILVPAKAGIGAGITDPDGLKRCFHRSPAGAVFASLVTIAQAQDPRHTIDVIQRRVLPNAGQRLALDEARRVLASPTPDTGRNTLGQMQYVGYKVIDYTPSRAVLSIAIQADAEHIGGIAVSLVWSGGDWKIQLRSNAELGPDPDLLASLDGYVRFRGS